MHSNWGKWLLPAGLMLLVLSLSGCSTYEMSILDPAGPMAEAQRSVIFVSVAIMLGIFVVSLGILTYVLIRFRQKKGETETPKQVKGNNLLEIIWTAIPVILIIVLAIPTVAVALEHGRPPADDEVLHVKVTGGQFWWKFEYPDLGIVTAQELHIPTDKWVVFELEASDVIHSFWVPRLGGKTDLIPGRTNTAKLYADEAGVYQGKCAEYCGTGHGVMDFKVIAEEPQDFEAWVAGMQAPKAAPASELAAQGEELFATSCASCHAIAGTDFSGTVGPDLTKFASRTTVAGILENNEENLRNWLKDPAGIKQGTLMPQVALNDEQLDALVAYLEGLQ